jgi:hypothetical protein
MRLWRMGVATRAEARACSIFIQNIFVTTCCEALHCAFVWFLVASKSRGESNAPKLGYRSGAESILCLAKCEKGSRIQQPSLKAASFCQFSSSKVE